MYHKKFRQLTAEYKKKNRLYPDNGYSQRPWEAPLPRQIQETLDAARKIGESWAMQEHNWIE